MIKNIDILLSVYNGAKYLEALFDSLSAQSNQSWNLIIRDDGSSDKSLDIITKYSSKLPITIVDDKDKRLGPAQSFALLMAYSRANYVMFCDQDDIWLPNKIEEAYQCMINTEIQHPDLPILVHTDLTVVDAELNIISDSFCKYQHINPNRDRFNDLLLQNIVTGCTCMINKPLKQISLPIPQGVIMHDWWLGLVATSFGVIQHINSSQILYRQHGKNDTGAKKYGIEFLIKRAFKNRVSDIIKLFMQGESFYKRYVDMLPNNLRIELEHFILLPYQSRLDRIRSCMKYNFNKHGNIRNFGLYITLLLMKKANKSKGGLI